MFWFSKTDTVGINFELKNSRKRISCSEIRAVILFAEEKLKILNNPKKIR